MIAIRPLTPADLPAALRIQHAAGWNQTETDWRNLMRLAPETSFGLECDGVLAATTTAICYERRLAWIGMVLTDPAHRRRGFARSLVEHALEVLGARGIEWIKLDATEMGAPLYGQLGFEPECAIERWSRTAGPAPATCHAEWSSEATSLDRQAFGADRSELLAMLEPLGAAAREDAYAMARPGTQAAYFGPCVSRTPGAGRDLLRWCLTAHAAEPVYWDLLPDNTAAVSLAREFGFAPQRRLTRMVRRGMPAAPLDHDDSMVYASAGFEYG